MRKTLGWLALLSLFFLGAACKSPVEPSETPKSDPSFSADIQPIFSASCAVSSCHTAAASGGLILLSGQSYANLVNVASAGDPSQIRVIPFDTVNSYLVMKLEGRQTVGEKMPLSGTLTSTQLQNIKNWVAKGALNN